MVNAILSFFVESERLTTWSLVFSVSAVVAALCILVTLSITRREIFSLHEKIDNLANQKI
jgi:hypothetical protein